MLFVFIHMGFRWPGGMFGWWLFGLSLWTTLTGILGVALQKWVPVTIARNLKVEAMYERIPGLVERLTADAATLTTGSGDALRRGVRVGRQAAARRAGAALGVPVRTSVIRARVSSSR